jgi:long-chain fatty acid transport protein
MQFKQTITIYSVAAVLAVMSGTVAASGFALIEQSASGLGNAFAGGAASAEDASTIFFNPAGMSRLEGKQIALALHGIKPSAKFEGTVSGLSPLQTGGTVTGGDAGSLAWVPNAYFTMEVNPKMRVGLGVNAPFGLQTEYDSNWMGRFQAIKSKLETVNLNPSISYQVNEMVSVGAGANYQRVKGELSGVTNYSAAGYAAGAAAGGAAALAGGATVGDATYLAVVAAGQAAGLASAGGINSEGVSTLTGSDGAWGYNFGLLFNLSSQTRVGVAYRSSIKYNLNGSISFANRPAGLAVALPNQAVTLAISVPDTFSVSTFHQMSEKWDVMADISRTGWSVFQQLNVLKTNGTSLSTPTPENWKDTWRVSAGTSYHYSNQWMARVGFALDQSPVSDAYRTVRIPDADRTWLSVGGQYKASKASSLDFGYAHLFVKGASLNQNAVANADLAGKGYLVGNYSNSVDILSVQYTHSF